MGIDPPDPGFVAEILSIYGAIAARLERRIAADPDDRTAHEALAKVRAALAAAEDAAAALAALEL